MPRGTWGPCCHPAPARGKPGTFWRAWPLCPVGLVRKTGTPTSASGRLLGRAAVVISLFLHIRAAGWFAEHPTWEAGPGVTCGEAPDCPPDRKQMALLPPGPKAGSLGSALRWSGEAGTPTLHSETHNCFQSPRLRMSHPQEGSLRGPTFLPSCQTFTQHSHTKHSCLLSGPSPRSPIQTGPGEALVSHSPPPPPAPPQGNPPASSLLAAWRVDAALSLLSTMDICHQGKPTVANVSPRHVSGPEDVYSSPDSL